MIDDQATCKPKGEPKFAGNGAEFRRTPLLAILTMEAVGHTMLRTLFIIALTFVVTTRSSAQGTDANPIYVDQGMDWTAAARADFYSRDQGSRL
ncbi:hypothetical protein, partial [Bradyrhizobium sp. Mp64]